MSRKNLRDVAVVSKVVHLFDRDRRLVKKIAEGPGLSVLIPIVNQIEEAIPAEPKRPIRLKIPGSLDALIRSVVGPTGRKTAKTYIQVLLAAARRYRDAHEIPEDWEEPDGAAHGEAERKRRQQEDIDLNRRAIVVRLTQDDRELLRNLGRGRKEFITRHAALCELEDVVNEMQRRGEFEQIRQQLRPSRLSIPAELDTAVTEKIGETRTYVAVLLAAAREYRRQTDDVTITDSRHHDDDVTK